MRWFRCICECGRETEVRLSNLRSGKTRSCGHHSVPPTFNYHGMQDSREYGIWRGAKKRCYNRRARGYANYGGRGIVMCSGWKSSFKAFYEDMGPRPSARHSIDRKDGNGHYSCGHCEECVANGWVANCCWATRGEQRRNSKNVRMLTFGGETMCIADWAKRKGMCKSALLGRLSRGMSVEEALRTPVRQWRSDEQFKRVPE